MAREAELVSAILHTFGSRPDLRLWRANVLVARDKSGRIIRAGIKGQADISGLLAPSGRRLEIECKAGTKQSEAQRNWQAMIEKFGGLYILARSVDDVSIALEGTKEYD